MTPARVTVAMLSTSIVISLLLAVLALIDGQWWFGLQDVLSAAIVGGLLTLQLRGWRYTPHAFVLIVTFLIIAIAPAAPEQRTVYAFVALVPAIIATVLLSWPWAIGVFVAVMIGLAASWQGQSILFQPVVFITFVLQLVGIIIGSLVSRHAQRAAEANAAAALSSLHEAEQTAQLLHYQTAELETKNTEQQQLLDLITTLETPAVTIADNTVLVPIVGHLDSRRASDLTTRILTLVHQQRVQLVILDLAGIAVADTSVARALNDMILAIGLLGAQVVVTGVSAEAALIFSHLGISFTYTARSPQDALGRYQQSALRQVLSA